MSREFPTCQDVTVTIPAGGDHMTSCDAEMVVVLAATDAFAMSFNGGSFQVAAPGLAYRGNGQPDGERPRVRQLVLRNPTANPLTVTLQLSRGEILDNRAIFGGTAVPIQPIDFNGPQPVTQSGGWMVTFDPAQVYLPRAVVPLTINHIANTVLAAASLTLVAAANANRAAYCIQNEGSERIYVKSNNSASTLGAVVPPGGFRRFATRGDVYAFNSVGVTQLIRHYEEVW